MRVAKFAGVVAFSANAMLMLIALQRLPYRFYQDLRIYTLALCAIGAWCMWLQGSRRWIVAPAVVALFFNPIEPLHFARHTWALLNLAAVIALGFSAYLCFTAELKAGGIRVPDTAEKGKASLD